VTLGQTYPHPIVDFPASRDAALGAYATIKITTAP
jgi:deoxyribodipyrimidine photolyase